MFPGESFTIKFPKFPSNFTGTGDLFAALMLAWTFKSNYDIKSSLEKTISTMQQILKSTLTYAKGIIIHKMYYNCTNLHKSDKFISAEHILH